MKLHQLLTWPSTPDNALYPWWRIVLNAPLALLAVVIFGAMVACLVLWCGLVRCMHGQRCSARVWQTCMDHIGFLWYSI